jgi:hypothetical protein
MPYEDFFRPGWASRCILRPYDITGAGAPGTPIGIPLLPGSQYNDPDNTNVEFLAQGHAQGAWPVNWSPGIHTPGLFVTGRAFSTWFNAPTLNGLIFNRNTNGEQNPVDVYYTDGSIRDNIAGNAAITNWGRIANFSMSASSRMRGPVDVSLNVLLTDSGLLGPALTPGGIAAVTGAPLFFRGITFSAPTSGNGNITPDHVEDISLNVFTGANYGKTLDGTLAANIIDSGVQTGMFTITQRKSAANLLHTQAVRRVKFDCKFYLTGYEANPTQTVSIQLDLVRQGYEQTTVLGNASVTSVWGLASASQTVNSVLITAGA